MTEISREQIRQRLGNISQIRELLFGDQMQVYEERFDYNQQKLERLEHSLIEHQQETNSRFSQLQQDLRQEIANLSATLEKKLEYLNLNGQEKNSRFKQELQILTRNYNQNQESLQQDLAAKINQVKSELERSQTQLSEEIQKVKNLLSDEIESGLTQLEQRKISRTDLADMLFDLCFKVKGSSSSAGSIDRSDQNSPIEAELVLPEQENQSVSG